MPPRQKVIILRKNLMGDWIDQEGNRCNAEGQRLDENGLVILDPMQPPQREQSLEELNRPDRFYANRSAIKPPGFERSDFGLKPQYDEERSRAGTMDPRGKSEEIDGDLEEDCDYVRAQRFQDHKRRNFSGNRFQRNDYGQDFGANEYQGSTPLKSDWLQELTEKLTEKLSANMSDLLNNFRKDSDARFEAIDARFEAFDAGMKKMEESTVSLEANYMNGQCHAVVTRSGKRNQPSTAANPVVHEFVEIEDLGEDNEEDEISRIPKGQKPLSIDTNVSVDRQRDLEIEHQKGQKPVSIDTHEPVDRQKPSNFQPRILQSRVSIDTPHGVDRQSELSPDIQEDQGAVSIDMDLFVDRQSAQKTVSIDTNISVDRQNPQSQTQIADQRILSIDTPPSVDRQPVKLTAIELSVDRHGPQTQISQKSVSIDTPMSVDRQKAKKDTPPPEPPEYVPEPLPEPKPPERYDTDVGEVLSHGDTYELTVILEEAATPGSCHKRKSPATTLQPPLKRMRAHIGAVAVHLAATYIIDPRDTYVVYSRGPRPPPPEQWYVFSNPLSSFAGRRSYPSRQSHPNAAYLPNPDATNVVYHMGPRPP